MDPTARAYESRISVQVLVLAIWKHTNPRVTNSRTAMIVATSVLRQS
jgi:hypothetical protein